VTFEGVLDLGGGPLQGTDGQVVVAKLDGGGRQLWTRQIKRSYGLAIHELREAPDGSVVGGGSFPGSADFGRGVLTADGDSNAFLAAWDPCGQPAWSKQFGSGPFTSASIDSLGRGPTGDVVVAGTFGGSIDLGAGPFTTRTYWETETFVAKYTASGTLAWNKRVGSGARGLALAVDAAGDTYVAGALDGTIDLGAGPVAAEANVFVGKLDPAGNPLWTLVGLGARTDDGSRAWIDSVAIDGDGNLVIGGGFADRALDLGKGVALDFECCDDNAFVAKIDPAGQPLWIQSLPGPDPPLIAVGAGTVVAISGPGNGFEVRELDAAGRQKSLRAFGGGPEGLNASEVRSVAVAADGSDAILLTGEFYGRLDLGEGALTSMGIATLDGFVARIDDVTQVVDAGAGSDGVAADAGAGADGGPASDASGGDAASDVSVGRDAGTGKDAGPPSGPPRAVELRAGEYGTCAALDDGRFVCWGAGPFGNGTEGSPGGRLALSLIGLGDVADFGIGAHHGCALTGDHAVWCWGDGAEYQVPSPSTFPRKLTTLPDVLQLSAGDLHTCVVRADQTVWCWGWNNHAEVSPSYAGATSTPIPVDGVGAVAKVVAGGIDTCALLTDETVRCWGDNSLGQTGAVDVTSQRFMPVAQPDVAHVKDLALGWERACALLDDGTVSCWGRSDEGGAYGPRPTPVSGLSNVIQIGVGERHTCALLQDGTVSCWGGTYHSALGIGPVDQNVLVPTAVPGLPPISQIALSGQHSCALGRDGSVWCWGDDETGEVDGVGANFKIAYDPVRVPL
jgi:alpha-tubulin suppressor-like RCC1 family protein